MVGIEKLRGVLKQLLCLHSQKQWTVTAATSYEAASSKTGKIQRWTILELRCDGCGKKIVKRI